MSKPNGKPLSRVQKALHEQIPGEQEREIYRQVSVEGRFAEDVAADYEISEARVRRILQRVRRWLEQVHMPINVRGLQALHLQRLEHQWHEAMSAWYRSGRKDETIKSSYEDSKRRTAGSSSKPKTGKSAEDGRRKVERTTREPCGDVRYLEQARKIMAQVRALSAEAVVLQQEEQRHVDQLTAEARDAEAAARVAAIRERAREREGKDQ